RHPCPIPPHPPLLPRLRLHPGRRADRLLRTGGWEGDVSQGFGVAERMDTPASQKVTLDIATPSDAEVLSNLLELYVHDLSEAFPSIELGEDGRFGYPKLPLYWSEPERRFAFLLRCDGRLAGFVLATCGSPAAEDPEVFDVAEFFVLRRYRR